MKRGIAGHQQLPDAIISDIRRELHAIVRSDELLHGYSSLAKGADQLFAQCVLDAARPLTAVLPCRQYLETFEPEDRPGYLALLERATAIVTLDFQLPSEDAFLAAGQLLVRSVDELIAVWDGQPAKGRGGTADVVAYARSMGKPVKVLWPASS